MNTHDSHGHDPRHTHEVFTALDVPHGATPDSGGLNDHPDRGDVPGWVMLTLMSAVLVAGLLLIAQPALEGLFNDAISRVTGQ